MAAVWTRGVLYQRQDARCAGAGCHVVTVAANFNHTSFQECRAMSHHRLGVLTSNGSAEARQLVRRYHRQMINRPAAEYAELQSVFAVCFRPGDRTGSFLGNKLISVGKSVTVVLSYEVNESSQRPF